MDLSAITPSLVAGERPAPLEAARRVEASQQFEAILLRQFLSESMKPLLEGGAGGQVYGYLITDVLAENMSRGGGLGLSSVIQAQLGIEKE